MKLVFGILTLFSSGLADLPDLGYPGWRCNSTLYQKSQVVPSSVNSVRYADIRIIGALGDSLTAANGAGARRGDLLAILTNEYRGLNFQCGGDNSLDEHVTLANILKEFNPDIFGYSNGIGTRYNWNVSRLNQAFPGAESANLVEQAHRLVQVIQQHPEIDVANDWKLINIFIGGNDMCRYCIDPNERYSPESFRNNIIATVDILRQALPRTIVSLTGMFDMSILHQIDRNRYLCESLHVIECTCGISLLYPTASISNASHQYMAAQQEIVDSGMFDTTDDFTLVLQPFLNDLQTPPLNSDGSVNIDMFAPDCFHFSQLGHATVAKHLWNNIIQPVGTKSLIGNWSDPSIGLNCPDTSCPFFPTAKNSANCSAYLTD